MEKRDYLLRQIEQLGQVLALMLARLLNLKQVPPSGLSLEEIKQVYNNELDLTLDLILQTPKEEIIEILKSRIKFIDHQLEEMAGIISETADILDSCGQTDEARDLWEKSIYIFEYLQENTGTYSLERALKISRLKERF
jgi:hypothetical protein